MSFDSLPDGLHNILNIIADISENDTETAVKDNAIITRSGLPSDEVHKYLNELRSLDLIMEVSKPACVEYKLYRINKEGLDILDDRDLR